MPSQCRFFLDKQRTVFFAGVDTIMGSVSLKTHSYKTIEHIDIVFSGGIRTGFYSRDCLAGNKTFYTHEENFTYLHIRTTDTGTLPPGSYSWPFTFPVTDECYSSLEGAHGHIRYQISLEITNAGRKYKNIFVYPVNIIKTYDLNLHDEHKLPLEFKGTPTCCLGLVKSTLSYKLNIPFGGYAIGQSLKYVLEIKNKASQGIVKYIVVLRKKTKFIATTPKVMVRETDVIVQETVVPDDYKDNQTVSCFILIPSTPPSTPLTLQSKITISYTLEISTKLSCCSSKFNAVLPIFIGTVPYRESLPPSQESLIVDLPDQTAGAGLLDFRIKIPYFELARQVEPPFVNMAIHEKNRKEDFLPLYPMYTPPY